MKDCIATKVVAFLGELHGFDHFDVPAGIAAIDLRSGLIVRPCPNDPDGDVLLLEYASGANPDRIKVSTHKLMQTFLLRHAEAEALSEGGSVKDYLREIDAHFSRKTGYGI